jgi:YCII-related domain
VARLWRLGSKVISAAFDAFAGNASQSKIPAAAVFSIWKYYVGGAKIQPLMSTSVPAANIPYLAWARTGPKPSSQGKRIAFDGAGRKVIDGPFAVTRELVAGFWLWEVKDMDEALTWVKRCPNPMPGPSEIEIRPLYEMADFQRQPQESTKFVIQLATSLVS